VGRQVALPHVCVLCPPASPGSKGRFAEVRLRAGAMVVLTNARSIDRIIHGHFRRFNEVGRTAPSSFLHKDLEDALPWSEI
jgi:hypothetical protein